MEHLLNARTYAIKQGMGAETSISDEIANSNQVTQIRCLMDKILQ